MAPKPTADRVRPARHPVSDRARGDTGLLVPLLGNHFLQHETVGEQKLNRLIEQRRILGDRSLFARAEGRDIGAQIIRRDIGVTHTRDDIITVARLGWRCSLCAALCTGRLRRDRLRGDGLRRLLPGGRLSHARQC
jgi:hypothetical protein